MFYLQALYVLCVTVRVLFQHVDAKPNWIWVVAKFIFLVTLTNGAPCSTNLGRTCR